MKKCCDIALLYRLVYRLGISWDRPAFLLWLLLQHARQGKLISITVFFQDLASQEKDHQNKIRHVEQLAQRESTHVQEVQAALTVCQEELALQLDQIDKTRQHQEGMIHTKQKQVINTGINLPQIPSKHETMNQCWFNVGPAS